MAKTFKRKSRWTASVWKLNNLRFVYSIFLSWFYRIIYAVLYPFIWTILLPRNICPKKGVDNTGRPTSETRMFIYVQYNLIAYEFHLKDIIGKGNLKILKKSKRDGGWGDERGWNPFTGFSTITRSAAVYCAMLLVSATFQNISVIQRLKKKKALNNYNHLSFFF